MPPKKILFLSVHPYTSFPGTLFPLAHSGPPLLESQCIGNLHIAWGYNCTWLCQCGKQIIVSTPRCLEWCQSQDRAQFCWFPGTWGRWRHTNKLWERGLAFVTHNYFAWNFLCVFCPLGVPWTMHLHKTSMPIGAETLTKWMGYQPTQTNDKHGQC